MANIWCYYLILFGFLFAPVWPKQNLEKTILRCADPVCEQLIAKGRTTQMYQPYEKNVLACKNNEEVQIFGKILDGSRKLWKVEIGGVSGFLPKRYIQESEVYVKDNQLDFKIALDRENKLIPQKSNSLPEDNIQTSGKDSAETTSSESMELTDEDTVEAKAQKDLLDNISPPLAADPDVLLQMVPDLEQIHLQSSPANTESGQDSSQISQSATVAPVSKDQLESDAPSLNPTSIVDTVPITTSVLSDHKGEFVPNSQLDVPEHLRNSVPSNPPEPTGFVNSDANGNVLLQHPPNLGSLNEGFNLDQKSIHTGVDFNANPNTHSDPLPPMHSQMNMHIPHTVEAHSEVTQTLDSNLDHSYQNKPLMNEIPSIQTGHVDAQLTHATPVDPQWNQPQQATHNLHQPDPNQHHNTENNQPPPKSSHPELSMNNEVSSTASLLSAPTDILSDNPESSKTIDGIADISDAKMQVDTSALHNLKVSQEIFNEPGITTLTKETASVINEKMQTSSQSDDGTERASGTEATLIAGAAEPPMPVGGTMIGGTLIPADPEDWHFEAQTGSLNNLQTSQQDVVSVSSTEQTPSIPTPPSPVVEHLLTDKLRNSQSTPALKPSVEESATVLLQDIFKNGVENIESIKSDGSVSEGDFSEPKQQTIIENEEANVQKLSTTDVVETSEGQDLPSLDVYSENTENQEQSLPTSDVEKTGEPDQPPASADLGITANPDQQSSTTETTTENQDQSDPDNPIPFTATTIDPTDSEIPPSIEMTEKPLEETSEDAISIDSARNPVKESLKSDVESLTFVDPEQTVTEDVIPPSDQIESSSSSSILESLFEMLAPLFGNDLSAAIDSTSQQLSSATSILLSVIAFTIVTVYTIHLVMNKVSREAPLLSAMNDLQREMRMIQQKNIELQRKSSSNNGQPPITLTNPKDLAKLQTAQKELEANKSYYEGLLKESQIKIQHLEQELEESTANSMEMHKMLDELLSSQKDASSFQASVDHLQKMLDGQREKVESLTSDLALKTRMNDELRNELKTMKQKSTKLEYQIEQLSRSLEETSAAKQEVLKKYEAETSNLSSLENSKTALHKELSHNKSLAESLTKEVATLKASLKKANSSLNAKQAEVQVSKECLKKLQAASPKDKKMLDLFDVINVKSKLMTAETERGEAVKELSESVSKQESLQAKLTAIEQEVGALRSHEAEAAKQRDEAVAKLEVLSKYFKEKEEKLTKELESTEYLRQDAEGSVSSTASKIQTYQQELSTSRSQIDQLKNEIEEQKQSFKMQLNNEEQKSHENWLAARTAERRQAELRQENGQLRQRLTLMMRDSDGSNSILKPHMKQTNGNISSPGSTDGDIDRSHSSPLSLDPTHLPPMPPMLPPPPMFPGGPMPPMGLPPPPHMMGPFAHPPPDRRLPPAGRIASPPFRRQGSPPSYDRRSYSPSSDHSHYSDRRYSPSHNSSRYSPSGQRRPSSPDRRSDRSRHRYDSRPEQMSSPLHRDDGMSPDRWFSRSPEGFKQSKNYFYNDANSEDRRSKPGQKTSTPNQR